MRNESEYRVNSDVSTSTVALDQPGVGMVNQDQWARAEDASADQVQADESGRRGFSLSVLVNRIIKAGSMAELARISGATLIVFAVSLYLMQGIEATNDLQRFLWLLLQTGLLGGAGLVVGYLLKEPRGARIFFLLGLLSIPANMAVLGAMIHSLMPAAAEQSVQYPEYIHWQASSLMQIMTAAGAGAMILLPMAWFAFSVFARRFRGWMALAYLFASTLLLIPVRDTMLISAIAAVTALGVLVLIRRKCKPGDRQLTTEERFASALLFLPPVLMVARSAMLYSSDFNLFVALLAVAYLVMRQCSRQCQMPVFLHGLVHVFSALTATCLAVFVTSMTLGSALTPVASLLFVSILGGLLVELSRAVPSRAVRWWMHTGWGLCCLPAFFGSYLLWTGAGAVLTIASICVLMIVSGKLLQNRLVLALGVLSVLANLLIHGRFMGSMLMQANWLLLACSGAIIVILGSLIDRYGDRIQARMQEWMESHAGMDTTTAEDSIPVAESVLPEDASETERLVA